MLPQFKQTLTDLTEASMKWTEQSMNDKLSTWKLSTANIALQAALPNNLLIPDFDENGNELHNGAYSVMVRVPMFYLDEVITDAPHRLHRMFKINGHKYRCLYFSKYQNVVINDGTKRAYSLPAQYPTTNISFDDAYEVCKNKGKGWHLMTNAEWAGIALWCKANGFQPKGNNNYGKDVDETVRKALVVTSGSNNKLDMTATGTGPASWYHDNTYAGIADMAGDVWSFLSGAKYAAGGEIQVIMDNNAAISIEEWKAINNNATSLDTLFVDVGSDDSVKLYFNGNQYVYGSTSSDDKQPSDKTFDSSSISCNDISDVAKKYLQSVGLVPEDATDSQTYNNDVFALGDVSTEHMMIKGGSYSTNYGAGVFSVNLTAAVSLTTLDVGFRSAYFDEADQDDNIPEEE